MESKMNVLITGSSGQLGSEIARDLSKDNNVLGIDVLKGEFTQSYVNITDERRIKDLCESEKIEAIVHTASLHAPHVKTHSKNRFVDVNINGTLHLLQTAADCGISKFVYTSTTSLYGSAMQDEKKAVWVTEDLIPQPRDIYDVTKIAAEQLCNLFAEEYEIDVTVLRTSRFWDEPLHLKAIYRLYRGLDVRDAAHAHRLAVSDNASGFRVFNISAQTPFSIDDVVILKKNAHSLVLDRFPEAGRILAEKRWELPQEIDRVYSIEKACKELGYFPRFNFDYLLKNL